MIEQDMTFWDRAYFTKKLNLWFIRDSQTNKLLLPFTTVYHGLATWHGPDFPATESVWVSSETYLYLMLKGKIKNNAERV